MKLFFKNNWSTNSLFPNIVSSKSFPKAGMQELLIQLKEVAVDKPVDVIIRQIKDLLSSGQLQPGDRLPPERKLSEKFGVGRTHVREAIRKLEFYGILKTRPQSGTYVASISISALENLISDVLKIDSNSFLSLVETREILEVNAITLACERRTADDLAILETSLNDYLEKVDRNINAVEEDLMYHLAIAEAGKNKVLKSLLLIITPDILSNYSIFKVCDATAKKVTQEHKLMFDFIKEQNSEAAAAIMKEHLVGVMNFAKSLNP